MDLFDDLPEPVNSHSEEKRSLTDSPENPRQTKRARAENENNKVRIRLQSFVAERKGERELMEDAHAVFDQFHTIVNQELPEIAFESAVSFYGVFDGHAGVKASNYAAAHLHKNFAATFKKNTSVYTEKEITKMLVDAFKKTDDDFLKEATKQKPTWKDGSTAITVVAFEDVIYIANLGDSKAILARYNVEERKIVPIALSKDHNPIQYDERMRIQKMGGHVREGRVMGILEVSRSIGDGQYKTLGVTCIPDIKRCQLTNNDRFIIIACDGLWKVFSPEASIKFILEIVEEEEDSSSCSESKSEREIRLESAAAKLSSEAVRRGSGDNVTVILIDVKHIN